MGLQKMFERVKPPSDGHGGAPAGAVSAEPPLDAAPPNPSELPPRLSESVAVPAAVPELAASDRIVLSPRPRGSGPRFDLLFLGDTSFGENYQAARERRGQENVL